MALDVDDRRGLPAARVQERRHGAAGGATTGARRHRRRRHRGGRRGVGVTGAGEVVHWAPQVDDWQMTGS